MLNPLRHATVHAVVQALIISLAACGGGDAETYSTSPAEVSTTGNTKTLASLHSTAAGSASGDVLAQLSADPVLPPACLYYYVGALGFKCLNFQPGGLTPGMQGTGPTSVVPAGAYCPEIPFGAVSQGIMPPAGQAACYQFVVEGPTTLDVKVALPSGVVGIAEIYAPVGSNGTTKMGESVSPASPLSISYPTQYQRVMLTVRTANGTEGAMFNIGVNATTPLALPSNSTPASAIEVAMNEEFSRSLDTPLSSAYYFYPLKTGQTSAQIRATFPFNHQVAYRLAQRTAPNTYTSGTETALTSSASGASITSPYPANTAGTATPYGVLVRVTGTNATASATDTYSLRVGVRTVSITAMDIKNTETLTRLFPTQNTALQAANYIDTTLTAKDSAGLPVKGQRVELNVWRYTGSVATKQVVIHKTDMAGQLAKTTNFSAACSGTLMVNNDYSLGGVPADHWKGTAQPGSVTTSLLDTSATGLQLARTLPFTRICSETFLGTY